MDQCLIIDCPVCRSACGETLGITGGNVGGKPKLLVVMQCETCSAVYLQPGVQNGVSAGPVALKRGDLARRSGSSPVPSDLYCIDDVLAGNTSVHSGKGVLTFYTPNVESLSFSAFGGRHWVFYQLPKFSTYYAAESLSRLGEKRGFRVVRLRSTMLPNVWLRSLRARIEDWQLPRWIAFALTGPWLVPQLMATGAEFVSMLLGRASLLRVTLEIKQ